MSDESPHQRDGAYHDDEEGESIAMSNSQRAYLASNNSKKQLFLMCFGLKVGGSPVFDIKTQDIDFYTFGKHFKELRPSHRGQHFKFVHDYLPLGQHCFLEASTPEAALKLCPCCRMEDETPQHFARRQSNKSFHSSMATLRSDILTSNTHPVRSLLYNGICHALQFDTPYSPTI
jgi:hypothetical protein